MASRLKTRCEYSTVIYSDRRDDERRIISAWRAEPHERRYYWKNIEGHE